MWWQEVEKEAKQETMAKILHYHNWIRPYDSSSWTEKHTIQTL